MEHIKKLNVGCGSNKIKGYINIDGEASCKPDLILDITRKKLPYEDNSINEIVMFHCLEHISKRFHSKVLLEFARVLKQGGSLIVSYPNFWECAQRWYANTYGERTFWEATIYGRQLYPGDSHVCIVDPDELTELLCSCGFDGVYNFPEPDELYNSVTVATKCGEPIKTYEEAIASDMRETESSVARVGNGAKHKK